MTTGLNDVFVISEEIVKRFQLEKELLRRYVKTQDIQPYYINFRDQYLILTKNDTRIDDFPNIKTYLSTYKKQLKNRYEFKNGRSAWFALSVLRNLPIFENLKGKIITPLYAKGNKFAYDQGDRYGRYYVLTDSYVLIPKQSNISLKFILGILNSKLLSFYNIHFGKLKRDNYYEFSGNTMSDFPIKDINFSDSSEKKQHDNVIKMVDQMINIKEKYHNTKTKNDKKIFTSQIDVLDNQIDQLVYKLYGITEDEISMIKNNS